MTQPPQPNPAWRKWTLRALGVLCLAGALGLLALVGLAVWPLLHKPAPPVSTKILLNRLSGQAGEFAGGVALLFCGVWLFQRARARRAPARPGDQPSRQTRGSRAHSAKRWSWCNVLEVGAEHRRLWQFAAATSAPALRGDRRFALTESLPSAAISRDWRSLWQRKLNIAWLPPDQVFLRVVHLPRSDPDELPAMLELQLEKLSPLPVNQIVWSFELLPALAAEFQTILVIIAERTGVEEFLGALEHERYLADRLELPLVHQLVTNLPDAEGTWLYLSPQETKTICLAAWWYGGRLADVNLIQLPNDGTGPGMLTAHLTKIAWGGEIEGWLTTTPVWNLVADESAVEAWETALRPWAGEALRVQPAPTREGLAQLSAGRAAERTSRANLLPPEFTTRYRQAFIDQLWMRGLGAAVVLYVLGVLGYLGWLQVLDYQKNNLQREVVQLSGTYTNALRLKERVKVFQEQANLKSLALDCLRVTSELLPAELTLLQFNFTGDKDLYLQGNVPSSNQIQVTEFNTELRKVVVDNEPLFARDKVQPPKFTSPGGPNTQISRWDFSAGLNLAETR